MLLLYPLEPVIHSLVLRGLLGHAPLRIEVGGPGLELQALRRRRDDPVLLLMGEERMLFLHGLLVMQLLLLEILDLRIDAGDDGVAGGRRGDHSGRDRLVGLCGGHRRSDLVLEARIRSCYDDGSLGAAHRRVHMVPRRRRCLHWHVCDRGVLKVVKVEIEALGQGAHAVHIQKLLKVIVGAGVHSMLLPAPSRGTHHGHGSLRPSDEAMYAKKKLCLSF